MDDTIHKIIAAVSPETYCQREKETDDGVIEDLPKYIRKMVEKNGYGNVKEGAIKEALPLKPKDLPSYNYEKAKADALNLWGLSSPMEQHVITYDSPAEGLEPVYFWLLDYLGSGLMRGLYNSVEKLTDNFVSSPGSGHFSEMQGKATQMQQEVSRTMGNVNTVLKSVLNLVYDLKEFRIRLTPYKIYKDKNSSESEKFKQLLSLKQVWLDNVDIRKGRGSINALSSGELDFVTLRDAFMSLKSLEQASKKPEEGGIDLNERVKRILQQRAQEFFMWIEESYNSLTQRYEIERNYLKSQDNMLKLYAKWVKPYLKAASRLEQNMDSKNPGLVTAFNTMVMELKVLAYSEHKTKDDVDNGLLPEFFKDLKEKDVRKYFKVLIVELEFRGIPQRVSQRGDWSFGGKVEIRFTSYALNKDELNVFKDELNRDDFSSMLKLVEGATDESLKQIEKDVRALVEGKEIEDIEKEEKEKKEEKERKKKEGDDFGLNGFFSLFKIKKKPKVKIDYKKPLPVDNNYEKVLRSQAIITANESCFNTFDNYKRGHGMPSHSNPFKTL